MPWCVCWGVSRRLSLPDPHLQSPQPRSDICFNPRQGLRAGAHRVSVALPDALWLVRGGGWGVGQTTKRVLFSQLI